MEANQEKLEAVVEHYKHAPCVKAINLPTTQQGWDSDILHTVPEGAMYNESVGVLEN
jgi:hypothetical protein